MPVTDMIGATRKKQSPLPTQSIRIMARVTFYQLSYFTDCLAGESLRNQKSANLIAG